MDYGGGAFETPNPPPPFEHAHAYEYTVIGCDDNNVQQ